MDCWELPENALKKMVSYPGRNEQANIHVDSSLGGSVDFVLCAIGAHPVCLQSHYPEEVIKEEVPNEAEEAELTLINLSFPDTVQARRPMYLDWRYSSNSAYDTACGWNGT